MSYFKVYIVDGNQMRQAKKTPTYLMINNKNQFYKSTFCFIKSAEKNLNSFG